VDHVPFVQMVFFSLPSDLLPDVTMSKTMLVLLEQEQELLTLRKHMASPLFACSVGFPLI
jgi:hypothetical protein